MSGILIAIKRTLSDRRYLAAGCDYCSYFFCVVLNSVKTVPGNSGAFKLLFWVEGLDNFGDDRDFKCTFYYD